MSAYVIANREAALNFYDDPAYEPYRDLRQSISDPNLIIVDGWE